MTRTPELVETRPEATPRVRGLVSDPASERQVQAHLYEVSPSVRDVVSRCWSGTWAFDDDESHTTELVSDPSVNFVFERSSTKTESRIVGVWKDLWCRTLEGRGYVRGVKLRPGAMRAFTTTPAHHFSGRITPLRDVFGRDAHAIENAVLDPEDDHTAFAALEGWLETQRVEPDPNVSLAVAIVDRIAADPELITVEQLAVAAGVSVRPLQRLFRDYVGASPKWIIRRHRLQEVAARLERGEAENLASLAADLGYTDQAHLAHDFKRVVGQSPNAFRMRVRRKS